MRNTLGDLNNHLFAQLERLSDEELKGDKLLEEIGRARAVTDVASQIIENGALVLKAQKVYDDLLDANAKNQRCWKDNNEAFLYSRTEEFLVENIKGRTRKELCEMFNAYFGLDLGLNQITAYIKITAYVAD